ncbi:MAG: hypothetical protein JXR80_00590 [Deltaproteobacteria bacterium]|nr:hypothetical protein [Deltaproteobacteria bacterium]
MSKLRFTVFTKSGGGVMTKSINLVAGQLTKDSSQCWLSDGFAETVEVYFKHLPKVLDAVECNQAVSWGVQQQESIKIVSKAKEASSDDAISRTGEHFRFQENRPGVMMIDSDSGMPSAELMPILVGVIPELNGCARIERPSCSSDIYSGDELLTSRGTGRIYILVDNAAEIPRVGKIMHQRLILAGHGSIQISRSGAMLTRSLIDDCVWQPERLDFVAPPILGKGLVRNAPEAKYIEGGMLRTADIEDLGGDDLKRLELVVAGLKALAQPESAKVKAVYVDSEADKLAKVQSIPKDDAVKIVRQRTVGNLVGGDMLFFDNLGPVAVADVLRDPAKYDLETLADPLEPEYGGGRCKAMLYANDGDAIIHSFAHGSKVYTLGGFGKLIEEIEKPLLILPGGNTRLNDCAEALAQLLVKNGRFYVHNGELCEVST